MNDVWYVMRWHVYCSFLTVQWAGSADTDLGSTLSAGPGPALVVLASVLYYCELIFSIRAVAFCIVLFSWYTSSFHLNLNSKPPKTCRFKGGMVWAARLSYIIWLLINKRHGQTLIRYCIGLMKCSKDNNVILSSNQALVFWETFCLFQVIKDPPPPVPPPPITEPVSKMRCVTMK